MSHHSFPSWNPHSFLQFHPWTAVLLQQQEAWKPLQHRSKAATMQLYPRQTADEHVLKLARLRNLTGHVRASGSDVSTQQTCDLRPLPSRTRRTPCLLVLPLPGLSFAHVQQQQQQHGLGSHVRERRAPGRAAGSGYSSRAGTQGCFFQQQLCVPAEGLHKR